MRPNVWNSDRCFNTPKILNTKRVHLNVLDRNTGADQCVTELTTSPCLVSFPEAMRM